MKLYVVQVHGDGYDAVTGIATSMRIALDILNNTTNDPDWDIDGVKTHVSISEVESDSHIPDAC